MFLCGRSRYRRCARLVLGTSFALWLLVWLRQHYGDYTGHFQRIQEHSMAKMDIWKLNEKSANSKENAQVPEKEEASEMKAEVVFLTDEGAAIKEETVKEEVKEELPMKEETIAKKKEIPARKEETASIQKEASAQNKDMLSKQEEPLPIQMEASDEKNEVPAKKEAAPSKQVQGKVEEAPAKKEEAPSKQDQGKVKEAPAKKEEAPSKQVQGKVEEAPAKKEEAPSKQVQGKVEEAPAKKEEAPSKQDQGKVEEAPAKNEEAPSQQVQGKVEEAPAKKEEAPSKQVQGKVEEAPAKKEEGPSKQVQGKVEEAPAKKEEAPSKQVEGKVEEAPAKKEAASSKQVQGKVEEARAKKEEAPSKKDNISQEANGVPAKKEDTAGNELAKNKDEVAAKNDEPQGKKEKSLTTKEKVPAKKEGVPTSTRNVPSSTMRTSTPAMTIIPPDMNSTYIGDTYFQEDKLLHTKDCPSSLMKKMVGSDFQRIYLEKLPLLQWGSHATPEEYTRLRKYNGCFGWDVISWDYLKQTLSLLNTSANGYMFSDWNWKPKAGSPCIRCAVVGNGGILNGSKKGKEIDEHDYVFRVNGAILDDYVEDVGNRTSFYFFSVNTMMNSLYNYEIDGFRRIPQSKKVSYVFIPDNSRDYYMARAALTRRPVDRGDENGTLPSTLFGENYTTEQFKIMHPDFMRYLRNRFLLSSTLGTTMRDVYRPSTGATMLLAAVHSCDEVSAYGFLTPDYQNYSNHYYDKTKKEVYFYLNHDYEIEKQLWQVLHKQGIIKLYSRS
ncbi:uncharacterized protein LOC144769964 [Lissotriton helveticus]